jgi:probable HAF family extracellular repeat protein
MYDLGTLGGNESEAYGMDSSGQVVGQSNVAGNASHHAFLYSGIPGAGGQMHDLGTLGGSTSKAAAINERGQIVGYAFTADDLETHAFLYSGTPGVDGAMTDLGTLGGGDAEASGVNVRGDIVGYSLTPAADAFHAFLYANARMTDLGTLGGLTSFAYGINATGHIVGKSDTSTGNVHAFLYSGTPGIDGHMMDLGTVSGHGGSHALGINNRGDIVGESSPGVAFLYTGTPGIDGQMIDLDAWLNANNPAAGPKWKLLDAIAITDTGLVTGDGLYNDGGTSVVRAYVLDASALLPEPGSPVLMIGILFTATLGACRRR